MLRSLRRLSLALPRDSPTILHLAPSTNLPSLSINALRLASRPIQQSPSFHQYANFHAYCARKQHADTEALSAQVEQDIQADRPPTDSKIDRKLRMGATTRFGELAHNGLVNQRIIDTLTNKMNLDTMTQVQSLTINEALTGVDVLAQAKTGTGKTIGFLLPVLQNILKEDPSLLNRREGRAASSDIRAIIISPTRELAEQISKEAHRLVQDTGLVVQTAVGGTQKSAGLRQIQRQGCHILVGTPGRLNDILSDPQSGVKAPKLSALVLDEADRLMDQGFWPAIQEIQSLLPDPRHKDRQTLMFSATIPKDVVKLVQGVMKSNLHYVKTVEEDDEPTHERVKQSMIAVNGLENQLPTLLELCQRAIKEIRQTPEAKPFKAIVYFNATAETKLASHIFHAIRRPTKENQYAENDSLSPLGKAARIFEIHSRLSQSQRTAASNAFREAVSGILMSSDVTARGMDFPNVTHVIQVGVPTGRDTYIHRLGRTARAGAEGEGWLILPKYQLNESRIRLGNMPMAKDETFESAKLDYRDVVAGEEAPGSPEANRLFEVVRAAAGTLGQEGFNATYQAHLGTSQWYKNKAALVESLNTLARVQWGMQKPPAIRRTIAAKTGILNVPGLNLDNSPRVDSGAPNSRGQSSGGFGSGRGSGRGDSTRGNSRGYDDGGSRGGRGGFSQRGSGRDFDGGDRGRGGRSDFSTRGGGFSGGRGGASGGRGRAKEAGFGQRSTRQAPEIDSW